MNPELNAVAYSIIYDKQLENYFETVILENLKKQNKEFFLNVELFKEYLYKEYILNQKLILVRNYTNTSQIDFNKGSEKEYKKTFSINYDLFYYEDNYLNLRNKGNKLFIEILKNETNNKFRSTLNLGSLSKLEFHSLKATSIEDNPLQSNYLKGLFSFRINLELVIEILVEKNEDNKNLIQNLLRIDFN